MTLISGLGNFSIGLPETLSAMGLDLTGILMTALSLASLLILEKLLHYEETPDGSEALVKNGAFSYLIWIIMFAWLLLLSNDMVSSFIYFQF
jgi:multisubunit Na+/H+ antiporter MnhB subunit